MQPSSVAAHEPLTPHEEAPVAADPGAPAAAARPEARSPTLDSAACAQQLRQRWPALFAGPPKPIKLRIQLDIQERAPGVFTKAALSTFFRRHTGSTSYLQAVVRGKQRFDLDGAPAGEITEEHRKVAQEELLRRRANLEARLALEEQQRRNRAGLLRDFERTTLTRANFCVLKGVADDELDGLLAIARDEAAEARSRPVPAAGPRGETQRPQPRRDAPPPHPGRHERGKFRR